jgi:S1-C subfamily serine protease
MAGSNSQSADPQHNALIKTTVVYSLVMPRTLFVGFLLLVSGFPNVVLSQSPGSSVTTGSPFRVTRTIAGAAGHEDNSKFVMDDPRSLFAAGKDSKVIVYFEWDGPLGPHHFEGLWKSPEGKIVLISDFRYEAKTTHFSGYWTMLLSEGSPSGEWNLEARIDGEPAGNLSFVVTGSPVSHAAPPPQPLSLADMYRKAMDATVSIEKLSADGTAVDKSTGFWIADGQILTAFESIDGAAALRVSSNSGTQAKTDQVLAWNRWQDWAVIKVDASSKSMLKRGSASAVDVGGRCSFLEWGPLGSKLVDGSVTGTNSFQRAGVRLLIASGVTPQSIGGALLDEFGNFVGVIGGTIVPSAPPVRILALLNNSNTTAALMDLDTTGLAVPVSVLPDLPVSSVPVSLSTLDQKGEFAPLLIKSKIVQYLTVSSGVSKQYGDMPVPSGTAQVFSRRDNKAVVLVNWRPVAKQKFPTTLRIFTADNKMISNAKTQNVSISPGVYTATSWDLPVGLMAPGIYRLDLLINDQTSFREFIRITE